MLEKVAAGLVALAVASCATVSRPRPGPLPPNVSFEGTWDSTWGRMILKQDGNHVHGTFNGFREGGLSGESSGDLYRFVWDQRMPRSHGHGYLQISSDGQHLEGRWGYEGDDIEGGRWAADRDNTASGP